VASARAEAEHDLDLSNPATTRHFCIQVHPMKSTLHQARSSLRSSPFDRGRRSTSDEEGGLTTASDAPRRPFARHRTPSPSPSEGKDVTSQNQGCGTHAEATTDYGETQASPRSHPGPLISPLLGRFRSMSELLYSVRCNDPLREIFQECSR
jgi:hypothetical protein